MKRNFVGKMILPLALLVAGAALGATASNASYTDSEIAAKVAKEVRLYTRYSIWDNISFRVNEGTVEILGQVNQPYKKADLQRLVQHVPGVQGVSNQLEVLPTSFFD